MPDNYSMWKHHEAQKEWELEKRPICYECKEHIQDNHGFMIHGMLFCPSCVELSKVDIE